MTQRVPQQLSDFAGTWALQRRIEDRKQGQVLLGQGQAVLQWQGAQLIYDEELVLELPGGPISGTRRYLWQARGRGIDVLFADGRFFHHITLGAGASADTHHCDPDLYRGSYGFSDWPVWTACWQVSGPRKDYVMQSTFS